MDYDILWHYNKYSLQYTNNFIELVVYPKTIHIYYSLTHWGLVTHIWVRKMIIIGPDNGLSPGRRPAITWTNAGILLIGPMATNFSEILIKFIHFHSRKSIWKCRLENAVHFVSASVC